MSLRGRACMSLINDALKDLEYRQAHVTDAAVIRRDLDCNRTNDKSHSIWKTLRNSGIAVLVCFNIYFCLSKF